MRTIAVAAMVVCIAGCGEGALHVDSRELTQSRHVTGQPLGDNEVFYLQDQGGSVTLTSTSAFEHIEFHTTVADAEFRVLAASGDVVRDWAPLSSYLGDGDPVAYEGILHLPTAAASIELDLHEPVAFARFEVGANHIEGHEGDGDVESVGLSVQRAHAGRWIPPAHVVNAGNQQYLPYTGAPSRCTGSMRSGTRMLAQHLVNTFAGAVSYGGYNCRRNTADTSKWSVHGSGRAIDLFVPLSGGQADNDLGDPIANYLIENATRLGIEYIVWDRTSWGAHRSAPKHRYYGGPHPHHDHLHIELSPAAAGGAVAIDRSPRGHLDAANCGGIAGWAQDEDAPHHPIQVYVSIGGPVFTPGAAGYFTIANERREDLCGAIGSCDHGWYVKVPHRLMDGVERPVYAYGMDATGGANSQLVGVTTVRCGRPQLPYGGGNAVKRHITSGASLEAWGLDWNDVIHVSDSVLNQFQTGAALPHAPTLRSDGPPVYLVEGNRKRHVPNPRAMNAWGLDWGAIRAANMSSHTTGPALEQRPWLIKGGGPAVYLLWPR